MEALIVIAIVIVVIAVFACCPWVRKGFGFIVGAGFAILLIAIVAFTCTAGM